MSTSALPLAGIRVVELGALVAAPYCGMLLADLGAEVVKVEPPEGDMARQFAPFVNDESAFFMSVNRGKRSVRLDVKDPTALAAVKELVSRADVVIHNYRTGVAERLGLGYDDLSADNAGLVYCAVSGFGPTGPMAKRPGIDLIFQAESGMLSVTGTPDGPPVKVGTNAADVYAATTAALCIVAALGQRHS
jgi:CoA:oxalate CoA-transferase